MAALGTVVAINGKASVIDEKGIKKPLHQGDVVQAGDTIVTLPGVVVDLELVNGRKVEVTSDQTVKFTPELVDALPPDTGDSALDQATVQAVIKAIAEGRDINEVIEETAAGLAGGPANSYGFDFVDLLRITESVTPSSFVFDPNATTTPLFALPTNQLVTPLPAAPITPVTPVTPVENPTISIVADAPSFNENAGFATFTVTLSVPSSQTVTVAYTTNPGDGISGATSPADFLSQSGTLVFAPGETSKTIQVPIVDDRSPEGTESFSVSLAGAVNGTLVVPTSASTDIIDNDALPTITIADTNLPGVADGDFTVPETAGATPGTFIITAQAGVVSLNVNGTSITLAQLNNLGTTPVSVNTGEGTLVLTGYNSGTGVVSYTYDPNVQTNTASAPIIDSIPITLTDGNGNTAVASVDANITDTLPVAQNAVNTIVEDSLPNTVSGNLTFDVGADVKANPITAGTFTNAAGYGTLVLGADGSYVYTLNNANTSVNALNVGDQLTDKFTYTLTDGDGSVTTAELTITINGTNDGPVANPDFATTTTNTAITNINVKGNDTDPDNTLAQLTVSNPVLSNPALGVVSLNTDGTVNFTPASGVTGPVSITYTLTDPAGLSSNGTLTVTVNDTTAPVIAAQTFSYAENREPGTVVGTVIAADNIAVTAYRFTETGTNTSANGFYTINNNGNISLTAAGAASAVNDFEQGPNSGNYSITALDAAGNGTAAIVTLNETNVNEAPTAQPIAQTGAEDTQLTLGWSAFGASDVDVPSSLSIRITSLPADGVLSFNGLAVTQSQINAGFVVSKADIDSGKLTFMPDANESGSNADVTPGLGNMHQDYASFNYQVSDGALSSANATLKIDITAVADAPSLSLANNPVTNAPGVPASDGLTHNYYRQTQGIINFAVSTNIHTFEKTLDTVKPTSTNIEQNVTQPNVTAGDAHRYTGYIFLEAGHNYVVSGYKDDTLEIKLGGTEVYGVPFNNWSNFKSDTYTPAQSGYYSVEVAMYNGHNIGALDLYISDNGAPRQALNSTNFHIYSSEDVLLNSGVKLGAQVTVDDGGYYLAGSDKDASISLHAITTGLVDQDGSESLAVTVGNIPVGAILSDGTNFFTSTAGATTVTTTGWDLHNIFLMPGSSSGTSATLTVTSTSTEASNGNTNSTSEAVEFKFESANYQAGNANDNTLTGSIQNDVLVGGSGNDALSGGQGNDVLIGGVGNDHLIGGVGADLLWGGKGNDILTGNGTAATDVFSDVFVWRLGDQGAPGAPVVDTISDFTAGAKNLGGDVLNLKDLLVGEDTSNLQNYLHFEAKGSDTVVHISDTGSFAGGNYAAVETQQIVLAGVGLSSLSGSGATSDADIINHMITNQQLVTG